VELLGDLLDERFVSFDDDGHTRDVGSVGAAHGQTVNIEAAPCKKACHSSQNAGSVLNQYGKGVLLHLFETSGRVFRSIFNYSILAKYINID
jgi:hypothetical protein